MAESPEPAQVPAEPVQGLVSTVQVGTLCLAGVYAVRLGPRLVDVVLAEVPYRAQHEAVNRHLEPPILEGPTRNMVPVEHRLLPEGVALVGVLQGVRFWVEVERRIVAPGPGRHGPNG